MTTHDAADGPVFPKASMHLVRPTEPVVARVVSTQICQRGKSASFIRHIALDVSGTPLEGAFRVGQSFGVIAPGEDVNGRPHKVRLYSIASPTWGEDGHGKVLSTTPKRVIDERQPQRPTDDPEDHSLFVGVCSNYLCDRRVGDEVMVSGPNGKSFLLPEDPDAHDYVFLATGTGIAPFRGMMKELFERPGGATTRDVHLVMGTPYTNDLLYDDFFRALAERHSNFHYHTAVSREPRANGARGLYVHTLLEEELDATFRAVLERPSTLLYLCGLAGMQLGVFQMLARAGLGDGYLRIKDDAVAAMDPNEWTAEQIKRSVRSTKRCLLEVY